MDTTIIFEAVIDRLQDSKRDLLTTARTSRNWVPRSRYHLMKKIWQDTAQLDSFEELVRFAQMLSSPHCTLLGLPKAYDSLTIDSQPSLLGPLRPDAVELLRRSIYSFFENTVVNRSATIKLGNMALQASQCSPFPWVAIAQWTDLTYIAISATLPSLSILATAIVGLVNLDTADLDVEFVDASVPGFSAASLPQSFRYLDFGSRGHEFFSWLASSLPCGVNLFTLIMVVGTEDLAPFKAFAESGVHYNIDWLEVTFQTDRVAEFAQCLPHFPSVNEMTLAMYFSPSTQATYREAIQSVIEALDMGPLVLRFKIPSRLGIPWPLTRPTPRDDLDAAQLGGVKMRNHIELANQDQEEVNWLNRFAIHYLERRMEHVGAGSDESENGVHICVSADRGAVCHS